ncbi:40S ribosomal protein S21-1 [Sesamum angolense]|uniref:40S ribosomal protein S21-1 n=1 Tax=Sesamum angolense TaxID=2727404 RepID=A0AAE1WI06_9LAMI|nr:40S ribosomal protein S21-1 [Sesamum angolense]
MLEEAKIWRSGETRWFLGVSVIHLVVEYTCQDAERRGTEHGSVHSPEVALHTYDFRALIFSATNRLITSKDHASVQINIGHVDERGIYTGAFSTFALCGFIRAQGDADSALDRLWQKKKVEVRQQ